MEVDHQVTLNSKLRILASTRFPQGKDGENGIFYLQGKGSENVIGGDYQVLLYHFKLRI